MLDFDAAQIFYQVPEKHSHICRMEETMMDDPTAHPEEITFAELTQFVKAELEKNPDSDCRELAEKYGISTATMDMLIKQVKN